MNLPLPYSDFRPVRLQYAAESIALTFLWAGTGFWYRFFSGVMVIQGLPVGGRDRRGRIKRPPISAHPR